MLRKLMIKYEVASPWMSWTRSPARTENVSPALTCTLTTYCWLGAAPAAEVITFVAVVVPPSRWSSVPSGCETTGECTSGAGWRPSDPTTEATLTQDGCTVGGTAVYCGGTNGGDSIYAGDPVDVAPSKLRQRDSPSTGVEPLAPTPLSAPSLGSLTFHSSCVAVLRGGAGDADDDSEPPLSLSTPPVSAAVIGHGDGLLAGLSLVSAAGADEVLPPSSPLLMGADVGRSSSDIVTICSSGCDMRWLCKRANLCSNIRSVCAQAVGWFYNVRL